MDVAIHVLQETGHVRHHSAIFFLPSDEGGRGFKHQKLFDLKEAGESHIHNGYFVAA
jgi:hypothetical protein